MRGTFRRVAIAALALATPLALSGWARGASDPDAPGASRRTIAVLLSQDAPPYEAALEGLSEYIKEHALDLIVEPYRMRGSEKVFEALLRRSGNERAWIWVTFGSVATRAAVTRFGETPIVAGLVLDAGDFSAASNATGVVLEFPVETQLEWMRRFLPGRSSIGVIFNPIENQAQVDRAALAARGMGLSLNARAIGAPRDLPEALESIARRADVLWGLADEMVVTTQTAQPILLFSYQNRIPFVGLSATWVRAGALYALDRDLRDIGAQCAEMAVKILGGTPPSALPPAHPRKVLYSINMKTARHLKLEIPDDLVKGAQEVFQ